MKRTKLRVLVVEDHIISQKLATLVFKALNCSVDCADTGTQALELFNQNQYDLILMDLGLPDIDGTVVTKKIRELEVSRSLSERTPIVAISAHIEHMDKNKMEALGIDDFLEKPLLSTNSQLMLKRFVPHKYVSVTSVKAEEEPKIVNS